MSRTIPRLRKRSRERRWSRGSYAEAEAAREDALAEERAPDLEPRTRARYLNDLERHILPGLGHLEIAEITRATSG